MPATNTRSSLGELGFQCRTDRVHGAEHRHIFMWRWRLRSRRSRTHDEVGQGGHSRAREPAGGPDRTVELVGHRRLERLDLVVTDTEPSKPAIVDDERVTRLPSSCTSSGDR